MPLEPRPLCRTHVVDPALAGFALPPRAEDAREALARWASLMRSVRITAFGEQKLPPAFLTEVFYGVLGYAGPTAEGGAYTLSRERHASV